MISEYLVYRSFHFFVFLFIWQCHVALHDMILCYVVLCYVLVSFILECSGISYSMGGCPNYGLFLAP